MFIVVAESRTSEVLQTNNIVAAVRALSSIFLKYFVDDDSKNYRLKVNPLHMYTDIIKVLNT